MTPRRAQAPISFRSDKAAARLRLLTRDGRSQAEVIEDALEKFPTPSLVETNKLGIDVLRQAFRDVRMSRLNIPSMDEFDASEYDENGDPR